tara:strand:+ start:2829 stop:3062 length:234 start_codon:yes stop_codon:yes gene_type:complete
VPEQTPRREDKKLIDALSDRDLLFALTAELVYPGVYKRYGLIVNQGAPQFRHHHPRVGGCHAKAEDRLVRLTGNDRV